MNHLRHKMIGESWSNKSLRDYLLALQKDDNYASDKRSLSFFEKLFAILVTSYMSQDLEKGDNYLQLAADGLGNETLWKTATRISMNVPGVLGKSVTFVSVYLALKSFSNYVRWRDYSLTHKTILPLSALFPEFIRCIISFPVYDKYLDFITLIYSAHYYLYDEESP